MILMFWRVSSNELKALRRYFESEYGPPKDGKWGYRQLGKPEDGVRFALPKKMTFEEALTLAYLSEP